MAECDCHNVDTEWRERLAGVLRNLDASTGPYGLDGRQPRIDAAITRRESDDDWSDYIASLQDAKPRYGP